MSHVAGPTATTAEPALVPLSVDSLLGNSDPTVVEQVRRLADDEFREDVIEILEPGGIWEAAALMNGTELIGFVVYGVFQGTMNLRYIAVVPERRGRGYGRRLASHVRQRCVDCGMPRVTLFAQRELVAFYKAIGFSEVPDELDGESEDDLQVPMELSVPLPKMS
eukprot:gnl/TRDRNA2_/TRDRNA2_189778_c0_seq1.p1 gnl/TRDRNA2_/TRDRNA2_189778_c0~~gnl/TRDRNA2_/TRDRNA2_189778_c0_seq1.p1  ORF type:complete len:165 (-),score=35.69 gnl/TRDRNA2_/TRDRNA2_189778_c0_seq1:101-595(-)